MHRFFLEDAGKKECIVSDRDIVHQIIKVFRAQVGDTFVFFSGKDESDYLYKLTQIEKKELCFKFQETQKKSLNKRKVTLFQALPNKIEKVEYILQKGVEVGINKFYFFPSQFSQKIYISDAKIQRFQKIIIEAVEQSGQNIIPELHFIGNTSQALDICGNKHQNCVFHHIQDATSQLFSQLYFADQIHCFVGPEGGWSDTEIQLFEKKNFQKVYFTGSVLRCETVSSVVGFYIIQS